VAITPVGDIGLISVASSDKIDDFEDGNISEYNGDKSEFDVQQSTVFDGTHALEVTTSQSEADIRCVSGLYNYPRVGEKNQIRVRLEGASPTWQIAWSTENQPWGNNNSYGFTLAYDGDLDVWKDNYNVVLNSSSGNANITDEWMRVEILHEANGSITVEVYHESNDSLHSSVTATDSDYITSGSFDYTGVMFRTGTSNQTHFADFWETVGQAGGDESQAQMFSRKGNDVRFTVISQEAGTTDSKSQYLDRRVHGPQ